MPRRHIHGGIVAEAAAPASACLLSSNNGLRAWPNNTPRARPSPLSGREARIVRCCCWWQRFLKIARLSKFRPGILGTARRSRWRQGRIDASPRMRRQRQQNDTFLFALRRVAFAKPGWASVFSRRTTRPSTTLQHSGRPSKGGKSRKSWHHIQ